MSARLNSRLFAWTCVVALSTGAALAQYAGPGAPGAGAPPAAAMAQPAGGEEHAAVLAALPGTAHTLAEGIAAVAVGTEVPIEAKFEVEDGALQLSVYTAAMGLDPLPESNSFKEYKGPATQAAWAPETETFEDFEHIARSASYATLLAMTDITIPQIIDSASEGGGSVISVKPKVVDGQPVFEVFAVRGSDVLELHYDLVTGSPVA